MDKELVEALVSTKTDRSHLSLISTGKIDPKFPRAIVRSTAVVSLVKNVTSRSDQYARINEEREAMTDRSSATKEEFHKQASTWRKEEAINRIQNQGKDWS